MKRKRGASSQPLLPSGELLAMCNWGCHVGIIPLPYEVWQIPMSLFVPLLEFNRFTQVGISRLSAIVTG